jgi:HD superfamily phosphohydrolase
MYWQVYLHKTVVKAEKMLNQIFRRARKLMKSGETLPAAPSLAYFLTNDVEIENFDRDPSLLDTFAMLDDNDILSAIKCWTMSSDKTLQRLSKAFINRQMPNIEIRRTEYTEEEVKSCRRRVQQELGYTEDESTYFVMSGSLSSRTYARGRDRINIMYSDGTVRDIAEVSDVFELQNISDKDNRHYLCFPKH